MKNYLKEFLDSTNNKSNNSYKSYKNALNKFFEHVKKEPEQVKRTDVKKYLMNVLDKRNITFITKENHLALIRSFFSYLTEELNENKISFVNPVPSKKYCKEFTLSRNDIKRESDEERKVLTIEQLEQILDYTRKNKTLRDFVFVGLHICTGARLSEIRTIRIKDINLKTCVFETGMEKNARKSSKHGRVALSFVFPEKFKIYLQYYLNTLDENQEYLFSVYNRNKFLPHTTASYIYSQIQKKVGFYFTSHWFRHSIITHFAENGCPPYISNKLLNHKIVGTQEKIYKHINRIQDYNKYFPYYDSKYF